MLITNYHRASALDASNPPVASDVEILTGAANSTIIKTLEIIAKEDAAIVNVWRTDGESLPYGEITLSLSAGNYVLLWEGFVAIPHGHKLWFKADVAGVEAVASVVEL